MTRDVECPVCHGSGLERPRNEEGSERQVTERCSQCEGTGLVDPEAEKTKRRDVSASFAVPGCDCEACQRSRETAAAAAAADEA